VLFNSAVLSSSHLLYYVSTTSGIANRVEFKQTTLRNDILGFVVYLFWF